MPNIGWTVVEKGTSRLGHRSAHCLLRTALRHWLFNFPPLHTLSHCRLRWGDCAEEDGCDELKFDSSSYWKALLIIVGAIWNGGQRMVRWIAKTVPACVAWPPPADKMMLADSIEKCWIEEKRIMKKKRGERHQRTEGTIQSKRCDRFCGLPGIE